jgi:hypothetical protein
MSVSNCTPLALKRVEAHCGLTRKRVHVTSNYWQPPDIADLNLIGETRVS